MTLRGHVAENVASCAKFLYVNRLFRRRLCVAESGEDGRKGWDEDIAMEVKESMGSSGGIVAELLSYTKDMHSPSEGMCAVHCCAVDLVHYYKCKVLMSFAWWDALTSISYPKSLSKEKDHVINPCT